MRLRVLYEDEDVIVMKAPHDKELEELVIEVIKERGEPTSWRELREEFSGIAGEDRLRRAIYNLVNKGELVELPGNVYALPDMVSAEQLAVKKKRFYWYFGRRKRKAVKAIQSN